jgi:ubiquinone/menaquinone biosynthesis C-methylase UbiE
MTDDTASFTGSVPRGYHDNLGPLFFEPYARILADRVASPSPGRLLETACGTGILTRRIAEGLDASARFVATDLNEDMLAVARASAGADFRTADMCALPFETGSFDCVVCQFGLMFPPDRHAAVREARRVLAEGGTWIVATWAPLDRNPIAEIAHREVTRPFPDDPPMFYETPFSLGDPEVLEGLLRAGGFRDVVVDVVPATGSSVSAAHAAYGFVQGNPVAGQIRARDAAQLDPITAAVERSIAQRFGPGPFDVPLEALIATAC